MGQLILKKGKYFIFFLVLLFVSPSCDKYNNDIIPYVSVSFPVNLINVNELTIPGNSVLFPYQGFGGIVIYCEMPGSYYAFDATCTNEIRQSCAIKNEGVLGTCPCCGSQFVLISGAYPSQGPATMPLKQYNVSLINDFTLRVYN